MTYKFKKIEELAGKTLTRVQRVGDEELWFYTTDNKAVKMHHFQDCCESVHIEDITGDLNDLVGNPLLRAEVRTEEGSTDYGDLMYTFYELATIKGSVTIRWYGKSNGYYSTKVDLTEYEVDEEGDLVYGGDY